MQKKTLSEWLAWQQALHPLDIDLGLERVRCVAKRLDILNPKAKVIVVAGTNGKGSSVAMLESVYHTAGYRVGTYTSPHLLRYNERIRINRQAVTDAKICDAFEAIELERNNISLSYFEFGTLAALKILGDSDLDVIILEVGLGGRLDAVNLVDGDVALITSIGIDHQAWLGADLASIATEKAGIMRSGRPVVINSDNARGTLIDCAENTGAISHVLGSGYAYQRCTEGWRWSDAKNDDNYRCPALSGDHQLHNAAGIVAVVRALDDYLPVSVNDIDAGIRGATLDGRFQKLGSDPIRLVDVAHNVEASRALANNIRYLHHTGKTRLVFGMLSDKDVENVIIELAPVVDEWYIGPLNSDKSIPLETIRNQLKEHTNSQWYEFGSIESAWRAASCEAKANDAVIATGSFYVVSDILSANRTPIQHGTERQIEL